MTLSTSWPSERLENLVEVERPITYGVVKPGEHDPNGVTFVRGGDIANGRIALEELRTITPAISQQYKRTLLHGGELLVSLVGNPGEVAIVPTELKGANIARQVGLVALRKGISAEFVMYFLRSRWGKAELFAQTTGSVQKVINLANLRRVRVPLPSLNTQIGIADALLAYDRLIDNNTRRIAILEEMARAIYREWFVDFRFPGHEQVEMVESELGPVPAGWEVRRLGEIASAVRRNVQPKNHLEEVFAHFSIPAFDTGRQPAYEAGATISSTKHEVVPGVILISKLNPRIPRVWLPELPAGHRSICSTEFVVLDPTSTSQTHLFSLLNSDDFLERLAARAGGTSTSHQRVKPADLLNMPVVEPSSGWVTRFTSHIAPMLSLVAVLRRKNGTLRRTRDLLLPRLISGEIDVAAMEEQLAGAG